MDIPWLQRHHLQYMNIVHCGGFFDTPTHHDTTSLDLFFAMIITVMAYRSGLPLLLGEREDSSTVDFVLTEPAASTLTLVSRAGICSSRP